MGAALNNVATADDYTPGNTLYCEGAVKLNLQVYNAAIFYKYAINWPGTNPGGATFGGEVFLAPGIYLFARRASSVAVRSAAKGVPAQVTVEALTADD